MHREVVTELLPTCQLGVAPATRSVAEQAGAETCAERLEDVEKFVRSHERTLDELQVFVIDITDRLMSRIERLEELLLRY